MAKKGGEIGARVDFLFFFAQAPHSFLAASLLTPRTLSHFTATQKKNKRLLAVYWQSRFMTDQTYNKVGDFHQLLAILLTLGVLTLQVNVLL